MKSTPSPRRVVFSRADSFFFPRAVLRRAAGVVCALLVVACAGSAAVGGDLSVATDFEGGSAIVESINQETRTIRIHPAGDPAEGWPCWWYLRVDGITPGETITLEVAPSPERLVREGKNQGKLLPAAWAWPQQATYSTNGHHWQHTEPGDKSDEPSPVMVYRQLIDRKSAWFAWGPPFTPQDSKKLCESLAKRCQDAREIVLCKSRSGRDCPALVVKGGDLAYTDRPAIWINARQHAWESGASWVCRGVAEWITSDEVAARELRAKAEIFIVPIMDIDHTAAGQGGKEAVPQDHNRDWTDEPHWNEVSAAQKRLLELIKQGRLAIFADLHNPGPSDRQPFFYICPEDQLAEIGLQNRSRFLTIAQAEIAGPLPLADHPRVSGPSYDPLWKQMSKNWVAAHAHPGTLEVCLETSWNTPESTTEGYRAVGEQLAHAIARYMQSDPPLQPEEEEKK